MWLMARGRSRGIGFSGGSYLRAAAPPNFFFYALHFFFHYLLNKDYIRNDWKLFTASFVYKRSFTPFRSDAYEEKPRSQDLLHAFFAPNSLFLYKIDHKTLKNHKKKGVECTLQVQERITNLNQAL